MPSVKLSDRLIANAKPPSTGRLELLDATLPGFGLRITATGAKSWFLSYRFGGRKSRWTIGPYPALPLAKAREQARLGLQQIGRGVDPAVEKAEARTRIDTFETIAARFSTEYCHRRNRTWLEQKQQLARPELASWQKRKVDSITRRDVVELTARLVENTSPQRATRVLATVRKAFAWMVDMCIIAESPVARVKPPGQPKSRDRVLSDDELKIVWRVLKAEAFPFGTLAQLLLLTAARRDEIACAAWDEVDLDKGVLTVPSERSKNGNPVDIPLVSMAVEILRNMPQESGQRLLFPARGAPGNSISGFSKAKARIDQQIAKLRASGGVEAPIPHWTLHDLRRTAATGMAAAGTPPHVVEKILNHTPDDVPAIIAAFLRLGIDSGLAPLTVSPSDAAYLPKAGIRPSLANAGPLLSRPRRRVRADHEHDARSYPADGEGHEPVGRECAVHQLR